MKIYLIGVILASIPTIHAVVSLRKEFCISLWDIIIRILILFCSWASVGVYVAYLIALFIMKAEKIIIYEKK